MTSAAVLDRAEGAVDTIQTSTPRAAAPLVDAHLADAPLANGARPHGFDRLVMRLSVAMLLWAQRRAVRSSVGFDEHRRRYLVERELDAQSHASLRIAARVF